MTPITKLDHKDKVTYNSWNAKETLRKIDEMARHIVVLEERYNSLEERYEAVLNMVTQMPTSTSVEAASNQTKAIAKATSTGRNTGSN